MRALRLLTIITLDVASCCLAWGDSVTFWAPNGANYEHLFGGNYTGADLHPLLFSSPTNTQFGSPIIGDTGVFSLSAGPLIESTDTSFTFEGGSLSTHALFSYAPLIDGYPTCEAAGLIPYIYLASNCEIPGSGISGQFTDEVTISLSAPDPESSGDIFIVRHFEISAPVAFNISSELALVLGVSAGPYFGTFDMTGLYIHTVLGDPGFLDGNIDSTHYHEISNTSIVMSGSTTPVPEPSAFLLLATALITGLAVRRLSC